MPHNFLVPAQALIAATNTLIVSENKKETPAKIEIVKALITARTAFLAAGKKYQNLFTATQVATLSPLLERLEIQTAQFFRLIADVETALTHFAKDVNEEDSTPVLQQIFNARVLKKEVETDSDSNEDIESNDNATCTEKALALFQDNNLFGAQLVEIKKKQETLERAWHSFFETINTCNIERLEEAHKALKDISKILIKKLHEIQTNHNMPKDDLGMVEAYQKVHKGIMQLHDDFQAGIVRADEMIIALAQQVACPIPMPADEEAPTSPTGSEKSITTCSSSFFSPPSSPRSSLLSEEAENDLNEEDQPPRKCARR